MSSPERSFLSGLRLAAVAALALAVAGCFRPLYGPTASGENLQDVLASIELAPLIMPIGQEYLGHRLTSELTFQLNGSGEPRPKRYKLGLAVQNRLDTPIVDTETGRANSATLVANVTYTLTSLDGARVVASGKATSFATYDRSAQRFANVRAARDAQARVSRDLAVQLRTRLAAHLATTATP
jgi:LPS-assembly lipoprotein